MRREEAGTDDMILIFEREGGREGGGAAKKHLDQEYEAGALMTFLALICGRSPRPRGLLGKFSSEAFPQTSRVTLAGT